MQCPVFPITKKDAGKIAVQHSSVTNKNALFPTRLRKLRDESGLSQKDFAKAIGVSKSTISLYETGDNVPDVITISKIADYYSVSVDYILCRTNDPEGNSDVMAAEKRLGLSSNSQKALEDFMQSTDNNITQVVNIFITSLRCLRTERD